MVANELNRLKFEPLAEILKVYREAKENGNLNLRAKILFELISYIAPKLTQLDLSVNHTVSYEDALANMLKQNPQNIFNQFEHEIQLVTDQNAAQAALTEEQHHGTKD